MPVESKAGEDSVDRGRWCVFASVRMRVWHPGAHERDHIYDSEKNQHERNRKFHAQTNTRRNDNTEQNDCGTDHEDGKGVADAPKESRQGGAAQLALPAHDGGDRDHVIGVGGVPHPEKKSDRQDGEEADQAATISTIEYGLLVSITRFRRSPHFATRSAYSSFVRSRPPGSTIITMSSSLERCGSGDEGTTDSISSTRACWGMSRRIAERILIDSASAQS